MDEYYTIESRPASANGYFTPDQARAYYGKYNRTGVTIHWWGDGTGADNHDNIVNYMLAQSAAGIKSVNYVVSDNKITRVVAPDNAAWCQEYGNATDISFECQPTLGPEGYKKAGWLKRELELRYGYDLAIHGHNYWFQTACPGTISLDRIEQECQNWKNGVYDANPTPAPLPPPVPVATVIPQVTKFTTANSKLVNIKDLSVVKTFPVDTEIMISGSCNWQSKDFYLSGYAMLHDTMQGFLVGDLKDTPTPAAAPTPPPAPAQPAWVTNAKQIAQTTYYVAEDTALVDITTGKSLVKQFKKGDEFVATGLTSDGKVEYRLTQYSFSRKIWSGLPLSKLSLTNPLTAVPVPPVPTIEQRLSLLESLVKAIVAFISKLGFKQ